MAEFHINGGKKLKGKIKPQGAKNEALQLVCTTLLSQEDIEIFNIPNIIDVLKLIDLLKYLGVSVKKTGKNSYIFNSKKINYDFLSSSEYLKKISGLRGSIMIIGPLLSRIKKCSISKPGGDKIGRRSIDTHLNGFIKLGVNVKYSPEKEIYEIDATKLKSNSIIMEEASVTGTSNMIMLSVMCKGTTTIYNAACEPYIQSLCNMLVKMGANISGIGSNLLKIKGVKKLNGCKFKVSPDIIEIGSFMALAGYTNSEIEITDVDIKHLGQTHLFFKKLGLNFNIEKNSINIYNNKKLKISKSIDGSLLNIYDSPWPGLSPDLISVLIVMCIQAKGNVLIHQKMFESRLFFVDRLIEMGAQIVLCDPHRVVISGLNRKFKLKGISMSSPDIRAGIALLIASLDAKGKSVISNINQIDRGYENIEKRLKNIGADIKRVS